MNSWCRAESRKMWSWLAGCLVLLGVSFATAASADDAPVRMEIAGFDSRDFDGAPALALTFSEPLDARQDYNRFLRVYEMPGAAPAASEDDDEYEYDAPARAQAEVSTDPKLTNPKGGKLVRGAWVVGGNPRLLYFPHIKPETRYVVIAYPGVPGRTAAASAHGARYSVITPAVPPAYYFASRGMVLPARNNGGLPVMTVNVPEVDIEFMRVRPDQVARFLDLVIQGRRAPAKDPDEEDEAEDRHRDLKGAVGYWELRDLHEMADSIYSGRFLTEKKPNRKSVTFIPVEDLKTLAEPGIYVAIMRRPGRFRGDYQVSYYYVSNLALSLRRFEKTADVYVSSLDKGKAVPHIIVSWLDQKGKILAQGTTDAQGRAHFAAQPAGAKVLMARRGREISLIALKEAALDLSEYDIGGREGKPIALFAYSGRNLYRPGEKFEVSVLARDDDGHPLPALPIQAILKAPDGKKHFTATWSPSPKFPGYYQRAIELPADAPTGFWRLELRADPADQRPASVFKFHVEEFLPERMKLELKADTAALSDAKPYALDVHGAYLYGAPAAGNAVLGVVQGARNENPLADRYPGFFFGDVRDETVFFREEFPERTLDAAGNTRYDIDLAKATGRNSPYRIRATISLLESGGRPVIRSLDRTYWPARELLALRPLFEGKYVREGSMASFEVIRSDAAGKLSGGAFPVRLFRENRNFYWRYTDQNGWSSGFTETDELVDTRTLAFSATKRGLVTLPVKYGRYRLEILDPETKKQLVYRFYVGWYANAEETQGVRPDLVTLKLDKPAYVEGETAHLTIKPPHAGEALVTVEGDQTLWVQRFSIGEEGKTIDLPIAKNWTRHDLYVTATVLRPGGEGDKVTPARALGVVYLPLDRENRRLPVTLSAPKKTEPERDLSVRIRVPEAAGQKAMVTLSAVDVGILNITNFKTPDPWFAFFGKHRYGADQYDVYGRLIEKMIGQKGRLKFGGDSGETLNEKDMPGKVRLVDLFSGPVALSAQGEATIALPLPDFNGALRLMAVVATPDRFGQAEAEVTVAAPVIAELAMPRFVNLGDKTTLALDVHNLSGKAQNLQVELAAKGLVIERAKRKLSLRDQEKTTLRFPVRVDTAFGLTPITVNLRGGIKLSRQYALQVQSTAPLRQTRRLLVLKPQETLTVRDQDLSGFYPESVHAHLTFSSKPPLDVRAAIQGLLTYPYGCAEQTASTAYPHLFVDAAAARAFGLRVFSREQREDLVNKAMARLAGMQAPNGGFSLWGNGAHYEYWLSAYVSNFLIDAREQGFAPPEAMQKRALDFLLKGLQEGIAGLPTGKVQYDEDSIWRDAHYAGSGRFAALAYGAYVLARESKAPMATLKQLYESRAQAHSNLSLVHLGIALQLMGDAERARVTLAEAMKMTRLQRGWWWWGDYGSTLRDDALSLALLERHHLTLPAADTLLSRISSALKDRRYTSTQEKLALFLIGREMRVAAERDPEWTALLTAGKDGEQRLGGKGEVVVPLATKALQAGVAVRNPGAQPLYLELASEGYPLTPPPAESRFLHLSRAYFDANGNPLGTRVPVVGEALWVRLEVEPRAWIRNALVVDKVPAGFEIENFNLVQGEAANTLTVEGIKPSEAMNNADIDHVEYRDDRFVAALRLRYEPVRLYYRVRVVTPGAYVQPPIYAEDMYAPQVYGLSEGKGKISVTENR